MQYAKILGVMAFVVCAQPAVAGQVYRLAENQVPVAMVEVIRTPQYTEVRLQALAALPSVCWYANTANSPYLLARGQRFHLLNGSNIAICPASQNYSPNEIMVLRFAPVPLDVTEISLVEGQGGENQMMNPQSSTQRFWNFLRVPLTRVP